MPGFVSQNYLCLSASAGGDAYTLADQKLQQQFIAFGFQPALDSSPERVQRWVEDDIARRRPIVEAIGLKLE